MTDQELYEKRIEAVARAIGDALPVRPHAQVLAHVARAADAMVLQCIEEPTEGMYNGAIEAADSGSLLAVWTDMWRAIPRGSDSK